MKGENGGGKTSVGSFIEQGTWVVEYEYVERGDVMKTGVCVDGERGSVVEGM